MIAATETTITKKFISIRIKEVTYKVQGYSSGNPAYQQTQLKVNIRTVYNGNFYIDTIDLYSAKARDAYKKGCAEELDIDEEIIKSDLKIVKEAGVQVSYPDREPFETSVRSVWEEFEGTDIGELIKQIQEVQ